MMRPDDANIVGNVHGGTILKMIEEAGCIIGTRHCNMQSGVGRNAYTPVRISYILSQFCVKVSFVLYIALDKRVCKVPKM